MAVKAITSSVPDDDQLPLVADLIKKEPSIIGSSFDVITVTTSKSGQWLMLDTDCFRVMFNRSSAQATELIQFFKAIHLHEADKLVAIPTKSKKGGTAIIGSDDSERREYHWSGEELMICQLGESKNFLSTTLTKESFNATPLNPVKSTGNTKTAKG